MTEPLYRHIARTIQALQHCKTSGDVERMSRHKDSLDALAEFLPSGSGVDSGAKIDLDASTPDKIVIEADFHHMDASGMYAGWSEHRVIVRPSLAFGIDLTITGRNRNEIKEYLHDLFHAAITELVESFMSDGVIAFRYRDRV